MISTLGIVGGPPREFRFLFNRFVSKLIFFIAAPLFAQQKCKTSDTYFDVEWEPIEYNPPITAYILELTQNENNFNEVCFHFFSEKTSSSVQSILFFDIDTFAKFKSTFEKRTLPSASMDQLTGVTRHFRARHFRGRHLRGVTI